MLRDEVVFVSEEVLDISVFDVEAKVKINFVLEPVMEVVRGDGADRMLVVSGGPVGEDKGV